MSLNQNCAFTDSFFKIYIGSSTRPDVKDKVENAALIISIGGLGTDFNTGNFSYNIPTEKLVEVRSQSAASKPGPCPHYVISSTQTTQKSNTRGLMKLE